MAIKFSSLTLLNPGDVDPSGPKPQIPVVFDGDNWKMDYDPSRVEYVNVSQGSHGFKVGDAIRKTDTSTIWVLASNVDTGEAQALGIVIWVADDGNSFNVQFQGLATIGEVAAGSYPGSLAIGGVYYISSTPGLGTTVVPAYDGVVKPVFTAISTTVVVINPDRPRQLGPQGLHGNQLNSDTVDDETIEIVGSGPYLAIKDLGVTGAKLENLSPSPAGTYGGSGALAVVSVDAKGRIYAASSIAFAPSKIWHSELLDFDETVTVAYTLTHDLGAIPDLISVQAEKMQAGGADGYSVGQIIPGHSLTSVYPSANLNAMPWLNVVPINANQLVARQFLWCISHVSTSPGSFFSFNIRSPQWQFRVIAIKYG